MSRPRPRTSRIVGMLRGERASPARSRSPMPRQFASTPSLAQRLEHRDAGGAGERVAAEGRAVRAGVEARGDRRSRRQHRADRHAAAEALGERHDVGHDAALLVGEQRAGAAHAGLHLVEDQQQPVSVAELAQLPEVLAGAAR